MTALQLSDWAGQLDGLLPQVYWTDFNESALTCIPPPS
jgi:hypothetical protein